MDIVDTGRHAVQKNYAYFKVNQEWNKVGVKKLLDIYDKWSNNLKRDVLDFDELYQDQELMKSVDAYIGKAFSLSKSAETKVSTEEVADLTKSGLKRQLSGEINPKPSISHQIQETNVDLRTLHKNGPNKIQQNDSTVDQNGIQLQTPKNVSNIQNINSQNNVTAPAACALRMLDPFKIKERDNQLKNNNEFCMSAKNVNLKQITPMKDTSSNWNICKQTTSTNEVIHSNKQQLNEKIVKVVHHRNNSDASSGVCSNVHSAVCPMNSGQGNSKNLREPYKQQFIKGNHNILCYQNNPLAATKNQTSMGLTSSFQCSWQKSYFFNGQNEESVKTPLAREDSNSLWLPHPLDTNSFSTHSSIYGNYNNYTGDYQHPPSDYFNLNTEDHLYNYIGENMNQPLDENMHLWYPQNTVPWDCQNYSIDSELDNDLEKRYELLQNYGGYFEPAEAILQSKLDNSSELVQPQPSLTISSTDLTNNYRK